MPKCGFSKVAKQRAPLKGCFYLFITFENIHRIYLVFLFLQWSITLKYREATNMWNVLKILEVLIEIILKMF